MKKQLFQEEFSVLDELLQSVNSIVTPVSFRDELLAVMEPNTRKRLYEKNPRCFLPVRMGNKDVPFLPICNRNGGTDKEMIAFSMKLANRLLGREDVDRGMLEITMKKLNRLNSTYAKNIPTPAGPAAQKALVTKAMITLKKNLDSIRGIPLKGDETEAEQETTPSKRQVSLP